MDKKALKHCSSDRLILRIKVFVYNMYSYICSQIGNLLNILPSKFTDSRFKKYQIVKYNNYDSILMMDFGPITRMRANTFYTKEPETIDWINSFPPNSTLLDIGANVGSYSIYAAKKGHKVISVEPDPSNFAILLRNIYLNALHSNITPLLVAFSNSRSLTNFNLNSISFGGALHSASEAADGQYHFMCSSTTVDDFINQVNFAPNYLKIDVDGLERTILSNSTNLLSSSTLKSILVELEQGSEEEKDVISQLNSFGFHLISKRHAEQFNKGPYKNFYNYAFARYE
jgi:FkbM family methyltransferase